MAAVKNFNMGFDPFAELTATTTGNQTKAFEDVLPGFGDLSSTATANIRNLLQGLPSVDQTRLDNAYYGAGTGLNPTSPFLINRGRGLYGQRAEGMRQQGLQNFLQLIGGFSGNVVPSAGQISSQQFQQQQSALDRALQRELNGLRNPSAGTFSPSPTLRFPYQR